MAMAIRSYGASMRIAGLLMLPVCIWMIDYKTTGAGDFSLCLFKNLTGHACYGCGLLRGISAVLHFDFVAAYQLNRMNVLSIPVMVYLYWKEWVGLLKTSGACSKKLEIVSGE